MQNAPIFIATHTTRPQTTQIPMAAPAEKPLLPGDAGCAAAAVAVAEVEEVFDIVVEVAVEISEAQLYLSSSSSLMGWSRPSSRCG